MCNQLIPPQMASCEGMISPQMAGPEARMVFLYGKILAFRHWQHYSNLAYKMKQQIYLLSSPI